MRRLIDDYKAENFKGEDFILAGIAFFAIMAGLCLAEWIDCLL